MEIAVGSDDPTPWSEHTSDYPTPAQKKGSNGSKQLDQVGGLYKRLTPAILVLLEFKETLDTLKNISKPTKEKIDHIFRFSTSLALE